MIFVLFWRPFFWIKQVSLNCDVDICLIIVFFMKCEKQTIFCFALRHTFYWYMTFAQTTHSKEVIFWHHSLLPAHACSVVNMLSLPSSSIRSLLNGTHLWHSSPGKMEHIQLNRLKNKSLFKHLNYNLTVSFLSVLLPSMSDIQLLLNIVGFWCSSSDKMQHT